MLAGLIVNAGDQMLAGVQRSMLTSVLAVFSEPVTLDSGAFTIDLEPDVSINYGSGTTIGEIPDLTWSTSDGGITWLITFSGDGVVSGCIADGVYVVTTHHDLVHGSNGDMAADRDNILHRFFGDIDGNGVVNGTWGDGDVFDASYGASTGDPSFLYGFDFDLSGTIDSPDSTAFNANLGTTWSWTTLESVIIAYSATRFDAAGNVLEYISGDAYEDETVKFVYTYDAAHRQTSQTRNGVTTDYDYDDGGQLTGEDSSLVTAAYTYDANGNRTMSGYTTGDGAGGDPDSNRVTSDGIWDYTYDDEGNLIQRSSIGTSELWLYEYDNRNHLIQAVRKTDGTTTDLTVIYSYDAWGNRVSKSVDSGGGAVQLSFVLDGWNPAKAGSVGLSRFDVWADVDGDVVTQYMRGDLIDQLIGRSDLVTPYDGTYWYLTDVLGTVRGNTNKWGQLIDAIDYDAFGNIVGETQPDYTGRYGFGGREYDAETGFYSNRDRQYNPQTGRFNQEDPISFRAGDPNIYRYVHNAPTNGTDPSGRIWGWAAAAIGATIGVVAYTVGATVATAWTGRNQFSVGGFVGAAAGGAAAGLVVGAFTGDVTSIAGLAVLGAGAGAVGGATTGVVGTLTDQAIASVRTGENKFDSIAVAKNGIAGFVGGGIGGAFGGAALGQFGSGLTSALATGTTSGALGGAVSGGLDAYMSGADGAGVLSGALSGSLSGAASGLAGAAMANQVSNCWRGTATRERAVGASLNEANAISADGNRAMGGAGRAGDQIFVGRSKLGPGGPITNAEVISVLQNKVPNPRFTCVEPRLIGQILDAGLSPQGAVLVPTFGGGKLHGTVASPCPSCQSLVHYFGASVPLIKNSWIAASNSSQANSNDNRK